MKKHPNVYRTWTLTIPTDTMPAVNEPKAMVQFMRELSDVCGDFCDHQFLSIAGDVYRKEVKVTFKYHRTAVEFADMWFSARAKVLAELQRDRRQDDLDDLPF